MEPLPDLAILSDEDLKRLIDEYTQEEQEVSYRRRLLHGKIDILRAELVARLQKTKGRSVLDYPERQDWRAIFDTMTKDGYTGPFGLETHIFGEGQIQASHDSMKEILRILG